MFDSDGKDILFLVERMEPALSSTILKFPQFFPASLQAKIAEISKWLMIWLVPSFQLKTKYLFLSYVKSNYHYQGVEIMTLELEKIIFLIQG